MIVSVNTKQIWKIQKVAHRTWPDTFKNILSDAQLYYMLDMMYSSQSLIQQMEDGVQFYTYELENEIMGFIGYQLLNTNQSIIKIHKIYVDPKFQKRSIGRHLMEQATKEAKRHNVDFISLNVNRFNTAVEFYKKLGFTISKIEDIDIGNQYLMEDYVMDLQISQSKA